ncbi:MAG TPA: (d)CMP kinase [Verrucomicrobiae bacterium]|nr:(d)CMP kinase [Verrucomicrobiae bacterium]
MNPVIAIDGPSASGKSTVARRVAAQLGFVYVDTGAMYRAVTWRLLHEGIDPAKTAAVAAFSERMDFHAIIKGGTTRLECNGPIDPDALRSPDVSSAVALVARVPETRARLVAEQRSLRALAPLVMEGRDIGSVVFPNTPYKFYLDARPEVREARRHLQGEEDAINRRDNIDRSRAVAPLRVADDARVIDSSSLSIDEVVAAVCSALDTAGLQCRPTDSHAS